MSDPSTTREALIAEALGELGRLLDRQEALVPAMNTATEALLDAQDQLMHRLATLDAQIEALSGRATVDATRRMVARAETAGRLLAGAHAQGIAEAGRAVLRDELAPALKSLLGDARRLWRRSLAWAAIASAAGVVGIALASTLVMQLHTCGT